MVTRVKNMQHAFTRTEWLIGKQALEKLSQSTVAVFGIGGVGSFAAEALARSGIGTLVMIDYDLVSITNLNRQIHADMTTIGKPKVEVMKQRILNINPGINVICHAEFYRPETANKLIIDDYDYVVDAIDTIASKIDLVVTCKTKGIPVISSMGAGNKMDPTAFRVGDIYETSVDPIAKIMRSKLRKLGIQSLKVVFSTEIPTKPKYASDGPDCINGEGSKKPKNPPGSIAFVPSVAGLIMAAEVVRDLIDLPGN